MTATDAISSCSIIISILAISGCIVVIPAVFHKIFVIHSNLERSMEQFKLTTDHAWNRITNLKKWKMLKKRQASVHPSPTGVCQCEESNPCPPGPPGEPGGPGLPGEPGTDGSKGDPGLLGQAILPSRPFGSDVSCRKCPAGPKGESGKEGPPGERGAPGNPGNPSKAGNKGLTGPVGPPGLAGPPGSSGKPGAKGAPGNDAESYIRGPPGKQGHPGERGPPGPGGAKGNYGRSGSPGKQGGPGPAGKPGDDGNRGEPGTHGPKGLPGKDATYCSCPAGRGIPSGASGILSGATTTGPPATGSSASSPVYSLAAVTDGEYQKTVSSVPRHYEESTSTSGGSPVTLAGNETVPPAFRLSVGGLEDPESTRDGHEEEASSTSGGTEGSMSLINGSLGTTLGASTSPPPVYGTGPSTSTTSTAGNDNDPSGLIFFFKWKKKN